MKKQEKKNYVDNVPVISKKIRWEEIEEGVVELNVENTGFYNTIAQKIFKKPRYSFIKLDKYGSCVWREIDGKNTIYKIGQELKDSHKGAANQLYERLTTYFKILERNKYVTFVNEEKDEN